MLCKCGKEKILHFPQRESEFLHILCCEISGSFNMGINCLILAQRIVPDIEYTIEQINML